ncbi:reverse transcriptase [Trichonephila clavipes]|nr:reverse transcriptase [Trichonephila clavipes]
MIVQFRNEKVSNHGSIPITIDCNVVAFIVFEEEFHQPIKLTKQSVFLDETLATVVRIPKHLVRAEAVALFRLTTGHDFLGVYLHWLGVAINEACLLSGHARIDGDHLLQCTGHRQSVLGGSASNGQEAKHGRWINIKLHILAVIEINSWSVLICPSTVR